MKIRCPNPDCNIKFEPDPDQENCRYCGSSIKNNLASSEHEINVTKRKNNSPFWIALILPFLMVLLVLPFLKTATSDKSFDQLANLGENNMLKMVFIYGFMAFSVILLSLKKKIFRGAAILSGIYWLLGSGLVFFLLFGNQPKTNQSDSSIQKECNEQVTLQKGKACTFAIEGNNSMGSGFIIQTNFIVTNRHVVEGNKKLTTSFINGLSEDLILWNYSDKDDLAVLKINRSDLGTCDWADSNSIGIAETLYVFGFPGDAPPGESSVSRGIYSRKITTEEGAEFTQTDASINPGNSGGPLVNKCGVVGINTSKVYWSSSDIPVEGVGFAISSNYAKPIIEELIKAGSEKKLPLKPITNKPYAPKPDQNNDQGSSGYDSTFISGWVKAKNWINEANSYWQNVDSAKYDQGKLFELKDLLIRMKTITDSIIPKIESNQSLSNEENRLLGTFNELQNKAITNEGLLDGQNYFSGYYHKVCSGSSCLSISGRGKNQCSSYYDCTPQYHYECRGKTCTRIDGGGTSTCYTDYSCKHNTCQDGKCIEVEGSGTSACYSDYSCYHSECQGNKCVQVNSPGVSTCYSDYSCQ